MKVKYILNGRYIVTVHRVKSPYLKFIGTPKNAMNILKGVAEFKSTNDIHKRDVGCKEDAIYSLQRPVFVPYRLHARIYSDSTIRVHLEPDLRAIVHRIVDDMIDVYENRGNWLTHLIRTSKAGLKRLSDLYVAFIVHDENSLVTGIDTGDYINGILLLKQSLGEAIAMFKVCYEFRKQLIPKNLQTIMKYLRSFF